MVACTKCGGRAVIQLKYAGADLCGECFVRQFEKRVYKANRDFRLFRKGETVAAAVSGGKDSLAMLHCLAKISKRIGFEVRPLLVDEGISGYRDKTMEKARQACSSLGLPLVVYSFRDHVGHSTDEIVAKKRAAGAQPGACSFCGVLRRKVLNKAAREIGADKVATGHNLDDMCQTLLMNLLRNDSNGLARFGPAGGDGMESGFVRRIRPLAYVPERESALYCVLNGISFYEGSCPYSVEAFRGPVKNFLNDLEASRPGTKFALFKSLLRFGRGGGDAAEENAGGAGSGGAGSGGPFACGRCGEPSSGRLCRGCELLSSIGC
ncbi:MAG: tRNA lysidine(34) synthetase TilS [Candidatus Micrarchaeota archaeon]|nr:tRNA lysidine(34) synthetase TilS [Candidatus Micrarchaeota archaeon]